MDKKNFYKHFDEVVERDLIDKLYNKYVIALKGASLFTNEFYTINLYYIIEKICKENKIECSFIGGFEYAERGIIAFNDVDRLDTPVEFIKISNLSKFNLLLHKDYLGSILSLGIERDKLGDLVIEDGNCYLAINKDVRDLLYCDLKKVNKAPVVIEEVENQRFLPKHKFQENVITVSAMRLDNIVSNIGNISRGKAVLLIDNGSVLINYNIVKDKSKIVNKDDVITIRKVGKFVVDDMIGFSKNGKTKVIIKKFT